uniref:DUF547 domain-containing protein n=1 Tax=Brassica campestris TaxID=3711 RepID=A0A3P6AXE9_BRACM|nr:unnamed protein product [Brassica rapa]
MHSASFPEKKRDEPFSNTSFEASQRTKLDMGRSNESSRGAKHNHYHSNTETSLKHEVDQLETRLEDQFKQATDLIKEIALLEMEVVHLEHYLLSLYRKAFDQQITPNSESKKPKSPSVLTTPTRRLDFCEEPCTTDPLLDDGRDRVDPVFTVATPSVQHLRVADLLHYFKTLISRLEEVDPSKLKHEEKLAFWINVHNALGDACKLSFFEPINLGRHITLVGHTISAEATQSSILGCKMSHPGQKFKAGGDERLAAYAINHLPSILLWIGQQWALAYLPNTSSTFFTYLRHPLRSPGSCIYTKKNQARARNVERIVYKNELNRSIPESSIQCLKGCRSKSRKAIDWNPPSFTFRYLILREAAK